MITDELVAGFRGRSPARVYVPQKPHPNGHLFYEAVSISKTTQLPYLVDFLPFLGGKRASTRTVFEQLTGNLAACHVIADSWFPSAGKLHSFVHSVVSHSLYREYCIS